MENFTVCHKGSTGLHDVQWKIYFHGAPRCFHRVPRKQKIRTSWSISLTPWSTVKVSMDHRENEFHGVFKNSYLPWIFPRCINTCHPPMEMNCFYSVQCKSIDSCAAYAKPHGVNNRKALLLTVMSFLGREKN